MTYSTGNYDGEGFDVTVNTAIYAVVVLVLFLGVLCINAARMSECSARTCPDGLTPTFTREGCVCLMRAK